MTGPALGVLLPLDGMDGMGDHMMGMSGPMWMPSLPPTFERLVSIHLQPVPLLPVLALIGLGLYVWGILRLRRRGARWSWGRTVSYVAGVVITLLATSTGVEGYGMSLLSVHMVQHMTLVMVVPILVLAGAPITLALRALPAAGQGAGVRRGLVRLLGSRFLRVLTSLPVRWLFFLSALYGIYFTPAFDGLMATVWGHNLMLLHFVATGLIFFGPLVAVDPWPHVPSPIVRLLEALASTPFHAFFGIALMSAPDLIVDFYRNPPASWGIDVLHDQAVAGGIAWATSEVPTLLLAGVILVEWIRSDKREAARHDRSEDRTGDAALTAYNEQLAAMARRDASLR
ncbi:membrane protein [Marmoricola endophyticus]|uniref:Membrane protein n=1 Tax=Marmoricola endophyticus TaxID=2040280 RepID=A0A917F3M6_9ACTN|nr:cytochrome c oxidase assembly protein [Marmoricola endophyticus]GGF50008.1 membrane protein [Marmoricola endophyticus]